MLDSKTKSLDSWVQNLDSIFEQSGLTKADMFRYPITEELAKPWTDNTLLVFEKVSGDMINHAASDEERARGYRFQQTLDTASQESFKGTSMGQDFLVTIGQKLGSSKR